MSEAGPRSPRTRWLLRGLKLLVIVLVLGFVGHSIAKAWTQLEGQPHRMLPGWLVLSGLLYLLALLPAGIFWYSALKSLGQKPRLGETLRAYLIGHLGKYVPGKAMVVVLRAGLVRSHRVDTVVAAASVFLETLTWIAVGSFLAAAFLAVQFRQHHVYLAGAIGLMFVAGLPTWPPAFARLARLAGVGRANPAALDQLARFSYRRLALGWLLMTLGWGLMGLSYWASLVSMGVPVGGAAAGLPRFTASVALATVIGFVAIVIPAGLGVREVALVTLMEPYLRDLVPDPMAEAWISAAVFRLVSVVAEATISIILYVAVRARPKELPPESP